MATRDGRHPSRTQAIPDSPSLKTPSGSLSIGRETLLLPWKCSKTERSQFLINCSDNLAIITERLDQISVGINGREKWIAFLLISLNTANATWFGERFLTQRELLVRLQFVAFAWLFSSFACSRVRLEVQKRCATVLKHPLVRLIWLRDFTVSYTNGLSWMLLMSLLSHRSPKNIYLKSCVTYCRDRRGDFSHHLRW